MTRFRFFLILFLFISAVGKAQVEQGTFSLAGGLTTGQTNGISDYRSDRVGVFPGIGYFINDNFGITGGFSFARAKTTIKDSPFPGNIYNSTSRGLNLFVGARLYFPFLDYRAFGQVDVINQNFGGEVNGTENTAVNVINSKIGFGANGWLSENISIEGIIKFNIFRKRSYEDRFRLGQGPIEILFDIKPYVNSGWTEAAGNADEFLATTSMNIGGTAGFRHSLKGNQFLFNGQRLDNPSLRIWLQPKYGHFIFDNGLVGLEAAASYEEDNVNSPISLALAPYFRYYIRVTDGLQVVPNLTYVFNDLTFRQKILGTTTKTQTYQIVPGLGLHTFLSDGIGLFGNGILSLRREPKTSNPDFRKSTILQFELGLEYYLSAN